MSDKVNSPKHYTSHPSGIECIQITEHYNFCIGNAMKYLWRQGLKEETGYESVDKQIEDCKKAIWYITRHITGIQKSIPAMELTNKMKVDLLNWTADKEAVARASIQPQKSWLDCND